MATRIVIDVRTGERTEQEYTPPPAPPARIPDSVDAKQFKLQLLDDGLLDTVEAWISGKGRRYQIAYQNANRFRRNDPMMQEGFAALGFDAARVDKFFTDASAL